MAKQVIIETPKTELEMFNLANEYNDMRASAKKRAITAIFEEMTCTHGYILVGNAWYRFNGEKCIRNYHMDICEACHREMEQEQATEPEQTEAAPETNPEPDRPEGKELINTAIVHCWNLDIPVTVMNIQNVIKEHRGTLQGISRQQIASRIAVYEVQGILGIMHAS